MSHRPNWEPEDGMGFAGLVPTAAEKRQEAYEEAQRQKHAALLTSHKALVSALGNYMSQFGQALDAHVIAYGPEQAAADAEARAALAQAEKVAK